MDIVNLGMLNNNPLMALVMFLRTFLPVASFESRRKKNQEVEEGKIFSPYF